MLSITTAIILSLIMTALCFISYICGYNARRAIDNNTPIIALPKHNKVTQVKETDEERKMHILLENINNYGTNKPQKEVI